MYVQEELFPAKAGSKNSQQHTAFSHGPINIKEGAISRKDPVYFANQPIWNPALCNTAEIQLLRN